MSRQSIRTKKMNLINGFRYKLEHIALDKYLSFSEMLLSNGVCALLFVHLVIIVEVEIQLTDTNIILTYQHNINLPT